MDTKERAISDLRMTDDSDNSAREVHLAEYNRLKEEQCVRIKTRDNFIYVMLAVAASVAYFAFDGTTARHSALLVLPVACFVLGWTYLANDWKVSEIGQYLRTDLAAALNSTVGPGIGSLGWETLHREHVHRRRRKIVQAVVDLTTFCVSGVAAVVAYWVMAPGAPILFVVISCVELAALFLLGFEIIRCVDWQR